MTFAADQAVTDFTTSLSRHARANYQGGPVTHSHLIKALTLGWKPRALAAECSKGLPSRYAWAVIAHRLKVCSELPPPELRAKPATPYVHVCNHPDAHVCPWVDQPDGTVQRCACASKENN